MRQAATRRADILIVGAGPTGLMLANLLGTMGVSTLIVERNGSTVQAPRAVSIDDESMRAVQSVGLDNEIAAITSRGYGSIYRGPKGNVFATVKPWQKEYGFEKRNAFQQPEFEAELRKSLPRHNSVATLFNTELVEFSQTLNEVTATLRSKDDEHIDVSARYMVACDGGRSSVRKALGIEMKGSTFEEPWLIVDLLSTKNRCFHTEVFCNPARSCITLPGPGGIRRYEFKLNKGETTEQAEDEDFARQLLASVGPDANEPLRRVQVYTFHARNAERWRDGRIFLAGDAAHLTPPFAGQGMNSGLRDAHNLAWKLDEALRASNPESLLSSYQIERKPHAWEMIELARRMGQVMMPSSHIIGAAIRTGFHMLGLYPPARDYFAQMKYKPKPRFVEGLLWPDERGPKRTAVGRMIPQPVVETTKRERVLLDVVLPDKPVVLIYTERPDEVLGSADVEKIRAAGGAVVGLTPEWINPVAAGFEIVRDHTRLFSNPPFADYLGHVLVLRRDRYLAAAMPISEMGDVAQYVQRLQGMSSS